ncbi:MAG: lytic murein transglycosylase [Alphaproteobacteria bacterium]
MKAKLTGYLACLLLIGACQANPGQATVPVEEPTAPDFAVWLAEFRAEAARRGISPATLDAALTAVMLDDEVIARDRHQPELTRPIWDYLEAAVSDFRIARGRTMLVRHADVLRRVDRRYGVPPELIVAIWGVETDFGHFLGGFDTVGSLATLAYDSRRSSYARRELFAALQILDNGDAAPGELTGSWAGAMGHTQFVPTTFLNWAVDFDGDGRRNIWTSRTDALASTANYLTAYGWRRGRTWGEEVRLPATFDWHLAELNVSRSAAGRPLSEWRALGVLRIDGGALARSADTASLLLPAGHDGPAFLVNANFRAILAYNNSTSYALAVALLSDRLARRTPVVAGWPASEPPLSRAEKLELQRLLTDRGYELGQIDGIVGPFTRASVRRFQQEVGRPADGFPTYALLQQLRQMSAVVAPEAIPAAVPTGAAPRGHTGTSMLAR